MSKEETTDQKAYNKLQSRRFWFAAWAAVMVTGIVIGSYIRDNYELTGIAMAGIGLITTYVGFESYNKRKYMQQDQEENV